MIDGEAAPMISGNGHALTGRTTSDERSGRPPQVVTATNDPLARLSEDLQRLVKEIGPKPKPRAVHRLRTTIRRFEALLPDPESSSRPERKVRKQLDRIRRSAGKLRDVDVHLLALRGLARRRERDAYEQVRNSLATARAKRQKRLARTLAAERDRGLLKRLRQAVGHAPVHPSTDAVDGDRILPLVHDRFAEALQAAVPLGADNLHALRIETKRLRYLAETAAPSPAATTTVAQLKRVQDAIGAWHDWLTLGQRAEKVLAGDEATTFLAAIRARLQLQLEKAVAVTGRVGNRLRALRSATPRKGTRAITAARPVAPLRSGGASA